MIQLAPPPPNALVAGVKTLITDIAEVSNGTVQALKANVKSWDPFDWITQWYHYVYIVTSILLGIFLVICLWYTAPLWFPAVRCVQRLRSRRQLARLRQARARAAQQHPTAPSVEMHNLVASVQESRDQTSFFTSLSLSVVTLRPALNPVCTQGRSCKTRVASEFLSTSTARTYAQR